MLLFHPQALFLCHSTVRFDVRATLSVAQVMLDRTATTSQYLNQTLMVSVVRPES
jgi:hypothetical protein